MSVLVRTPQAGDEPAWRRLWAAYLDFCEAKVTADVTDLTLQRILDPADSMFGKIAERGGVVVGFAICVLHEGTWSVEPICYMEDPFVHPAAHGAGVGRALLDELVALGAKRGWTSIYWHTRAYNAQVQQRIADREEWSDIKFATVGQPR